MEDYTSPVLSTDDSYTMVSPIKTLSLDSSRPNSPIETTSTHTGTVLVQPHAQPEGTNKAEIKSENKPKLEGKSDEYIPSLDDGVFF